MMKHQNTEVTSGLENLDKIIKINYSQQDRDMAELRQAYKYLDSFTLDIDKITK